MPRQYCFLCASDEGVFLDITADNEETYTKQFKICSLVKVPTTDQLPTKICHKCAYELNQCTLFVQKYKRIIKQKIQTRQYCCSLCCQTTKKEYIFDLSKDKNLQQSSLDKIQKVFKDDIEKSLEDHQFICLSCRYTVDVLLDLKNVSQEIATKLDDIISEGIDYLNFPKIKTTIINRKTTTTESTRTALQTSQDTDESIKMTRTRSQNNKVTNNKPSDKKSTPQSCSKCHSNIKTGSDTYKIQKTGQTMCKSCWTSMDAKLTDTEKPQSVTETKSCKVFLKDVLKNTPLKEQKLQKIEEKDKPKKTNVITEKPPTVENKSRKAVSDTENDTGKQAQKRSVKNMKTQDTDVKELPTKRLRSSVKQDNADPKEAVPQAERAAPKLKSSEQKVAARNTVQSSDSDSTATSNRTLTRHKRATGASLSDADVDSKRERMKLRTILAGNRAIKHVDVSDESSNEDSASKRKRIRFTSASPIMIDLKMGKDSESSNRNASTRTKKVGIQKAGKSALVTKVSQKRQFSESDNKESADEETQPYVCEECGTNYENKLVGLTHQLTHYKQPKLELEKTVIGSEEVVDLSEAVDDQCDDPTETIAIRVDDDEEETTGDVNNSDESDCIVVSHDTEEKAPSPKKTKEEATDIEIVVKEPIDDQTDQAEKKETEEKEESECIETVVVQSQSPNRKVRKQKSRSSKDQIRKRRDSRRSRSRNSCNVSDKSDTEDVQEVEVKASTSGEQNDVLRTKSEDIPQEEEKEKQEEEAKEDTSKGVEETAEEEKEVEQEEAPKQSKDMKEAEEVVCTEKDNKPIHKKSMNGLVSSTDVDNDIVIVDEEMAESKEGEETAESKDGEETAESKEGEETAESKEGQQTAESGEGEENGVEENDAQRETETGTDNASSKTEDTVKATSPKRTKNVESSKDNEEQSVQTNGGTSVESVPLGVVNQSNDSETSGENNVEGVKTPKLEKSTSESANVAAEVLQEVLDLASAEVQKRQEVLDANMENDSVEAETLENISREIQNSVDMPSLKIDSTNTGNENESE